MNTAIVICLSIMALLALAGWYTGRSATTDGDYAFVIPWMLAIPFGAIAVILFAIKVVIKVWN